MKLTIALVCVLLAASLGKEIVFKGTTCDHFATKEELGDSKGDKIMIKVEKDNECGAGTDDLKLKITIKKGGDSFHVKAGRYDQDKVDGQIIMFATVTGTGNVVTSKNKKE